MVSTHLRGIAVVLLAALIGCAPPEEVDVDEVGAAGQSEQELRLVPGNLALGLDRIRSADMIHGIAADERFIFVTHVMTGRVVVYSRLTGREIADIPPPPGGFLLPFTLRVPETGRLVVLDAGGFPDPANPATPRVYDYDYRWSLRTGRFEATLARTVSFDGLPVGFSEDVEVAPDGTYILSDSVLGSLWLIEPDGTIRPGLVPSDFAVGLPYMHACVVGVRDVEGIPYDLGGGIGPGVGSIAATEDHVYWGGYCHGGIHRISLATLRDSSRSAEERAAEIEVVSPSAEGDLELLKGLAFNRFDPRDRHLYATDCFNMRVLRIDVETGEREVVIKDSRLLNFPVSANFAPAGFGISSLFVASDQEHRFDMLNFAIDEDLIRPPFIAAEVLMITPRD